MNKIHKKKLNGGGAQDLTITWAGPRDNPNQKPMRSPGVTGMRRAENNWAKSAISEESFAMRVNGTLYSDPSLVRASIYLRVSCVCAC